MYQTHTSDPVLNMANALCTGYEWTRAFFERAALQAGRRSSKLTTLEAMLAGALAGSATVLITNPIWVVNTRMTARKSTTDNDSDVLPTLASKPSSGSATKAPSSIGTVRTLLKEEGFMSLFRGVLPALVLVINPILQYTIFEKLKEVVERRRKILPRDIFLLGAVGKLLATSLTYPYITVKSRMHVAKNDAPSDNVFEALRRIVREEGWKGLYGGTFSRIVAAWAKVC